MVLHAKKVDCYLFMENRWKILEELFSCIEKDILNVTSLTTKYVFVRLERRIRENEKAFSVRKRKSVRNRVRDDYHTAQVVQYFENNPRNSIRQASHELNFKKSSIHRILKVNGYHDLKYTTWNICLKFI